MDGIRRLMVQRMTSMRKGKGESDESGEDLWKGKVRNERSR